jgi:beta-glucanase (GH16 family)
MTADRNSSFDTPSLLARYLVLAVSFVLAFIAVDEACGLSQARHASELSARRQQPRWRLVFFDDFRKPLSRLRWGLYSGQPGGNPGGWWDPSHAVVRNGILNLVTYRDQAFGGRWVSAGTSSAPGLRQTYGKYVVRFRVDAGAGVGFALLLWPSESHWPPEIDFAEDGGETGDRDHIAATLHYGRDDRRIQHVRHGTFAAWHTAGVEWTPGRLVFTLDGRAWARISGVEVPSEPMEMDLQTAAGTCGDRSAPCPGAETPARVSLQVDWVAAYAYRKG